MISDEIKYLFSLVRGACHSGKPFVLFFPLLLFGAHLFFVYLCTQKWKLQNEEDIFHPVVVVDMYGYGSAGAS
jgi:hypothetical protein